MTAASIFAGESSLGSDNMEITDIMIDSTPNIGRHLSSAFSCILIERKSTGYLEVKKIIF
jgi:hypothetical protein